MKHLLLLTITFCHLSFNAQIIFCDDFESGQLNTEFWTAIPNAIGSNGISDVVEQPFQDMTDASVGNGFYSLALGKTSDSGGETTNYADLTLDLTGYEKVWFHYYVFEMRETNNPEDRIQIKSNANSSFITINQHLPELWDGERWGDFPPICLSEYLDLESDLSQVVIRFSQNGTGNFDYTNEEDGFLFDNICVWNEEQDYVSLPYYNDFESTVLITDDNPMAYPEGIWNPWPLETIANLNMSHILPSHRMRIWGPDQGFESNNALAITKDLDGQASIASFDLHFNLTGSTDCILEFDIFNEYTDNNNLNGIYLSTDGGVNWSVDPIFSLDNAPNWEWEHYLINIGDIIEESDDFDASSEENILRFQGRFSDDLSGSSSTVDGFVIDNLQLYSGYQLTISDDICFEQQYTLPDGTTVNSEGTYTSVLQAINGLDSTITTTLSYFEDALPVSYNYSICEGDSVQLSNGEYASEELSGVVNFVSTNSGCEQQVTENVSLFDESDVDYFLDGETLIIQSDDALEVSWIDCATSENIAGAFGNSFSPEVSGSYQAEIFNGECSTTLPCQEVEVSIISVEEKDTIELNYVNPISEIFKLQSSEQIEMVSIVNSIGQKVHFSSNLNNNTFILSTADFQAGVYTVHLSFENNEFRTVRILVN